MKMLIILKIMIKMIQIKNLKMKPKIKNLKMKKIKTI